jgi:hypothetical protein
MVLFGSGTPAPSWADILTPGFDFSSLDDDTGDQSLHASAPALAAAADDAGVSAPDATVPSPSMMLAGGVYPFTNQTTGPGLTDPVLDPYRPLSGSDEDDSGQAGTGNVPIDQDANARTSWKVGAQVDGDAATTTNAQGAAGDALPNSNLNPTAVFDPSKKIIRSNFHGPGSFGAKALQSQFADADPSWMGSFWATAGSKPSPSLGGSSGDPSDFSASEQTSDSDGKQRILLASADVPTTTRPNATRSDTGDNLVLAGIVKDLAKSHPAVIENAKNVVR